MAGLNPEQIRAADTFAQQHKDDVQSGKHSQPLAAILYKEYDQLMRENFKQQFLSNPGGDKAQEYKQALEITNKEMSRIASDLNKFAGPKGLHTDIVVDQGVPKANITEQGFIFNSHDSFRLYDGPVDHPAPQGTSNVFNTEVNNGRFNPNDTRSVPYMPGYDGSATHPGERK